MTTSRGTYVLGYNIWLINNFHTNLVFVKSVYSTSQPARHCSFTAVIFILTKAAGDMVNKHFERKLAPCMINCEDLQILELIGEGTVYIYIYIYMYYFFVKIVIL